MDVLTDPARRRWLPWLLIVALAAIAAASCLGTGRGGRDEPSFPHRVHVVDAALSCDFCHLAATTQEQPGSPPPELCAPCHDRVDEGKPADRRLAAFFDGGDYRKLAAAAVPGDVVFSHRAHIASGVDCRECHRDIDRQEAVPVAPLVQKDQCMDCHAARAVEGGCATCHRELDRGTAPRSHDRGWHHAHGAVARSGSTASQDRCALCHTESTGCRTCHQLEAPRDHDHRFRQRTHGFAASLDRERCAECHTADSCAQCHQTTRPQSHRGGFGGPAQRHCTGCHLPLQDNGCRVCHRATPAHDLATMLPPDHNAAMNCRLCHGAGVRLPHPDGGHVCTACHR
ncbi:MAG: cytochrome c3 family protein [Planctomycetota bacterium]